MKKDYLLTKKKDRKVQVKFTGVNEWVSSGCNTKEKAAQWAEANKSIYMNNIKADPTINVNSADLLHSNL